MRSEPKKYAAAPPVVAAKLANRYSNSFQAYWGAAFPIPMDHIRNFVYFARDREAMRTNAFG